MRKVMLLIIAVTAAGCGGGSGSSNSNALRQWRSGDQWVYSVTGTWTGGGVTGPVVGTETVTITPETLDGVSGSFQLLGKNTSVSATYNGGSPETDTRKEYVAFDPHVNGVSKFADDADAAHLLRRISNGFTFFLPSSVSPNPGSKWFVNLSFGGLSRETQTATIIGTETVSSAVGDVQARRVDYVQSDTATSVWGGPETGTWWIVPSLGAPVKWTAHHDFGGGETTDLTYTLTSTNVH